ncbi:DUF362 domain-containing protein [Thermodesulfobacteriota bacterium]
MKHKVLIMKCDEYDPGRIASIISEGMKELGVEPHGKTMLKPNTVIALPGVFPHAFTRSEFLDGALKATRDRGKEMTELSVGERCGITVPTRFAFKNAGYPEVIRKHGAKAHYFDETRQVPVKLTRSENLRDLIYVPKPVADCDFLINLPKFKAHPWTRLTLSLKNYIGLQDDRHRLVDHNTFLEHKIVDLQDVIPSRFIAVDAIIAGQRMMLTPTPFPMGAILMGTNSCAVDTVGCHMVNVDPEDLIHLKLASERGLGPMSLDNIDVDGDFPLDEVQHKTKDFQFCLEKVDNYFKDSPGISCTVGSFPEDHSKDYCWGGCPGALQEAMHIFEGYHPNIDDRMKKIRYVVGKVDGPLDLEPGEKVLFAGDCCQWEGTLDGEPVKIAGDYKTTSKVDARKTKTNDMILKILGPVLHCLFNGKSRHIHAKGCPVSVGSHVNYVSYLSKIPNVNFDARQVVSINLDYWRMQMAKLYNRFFG